MDTFVFRAVDRRGAVSSACRFMISTDGGQTFTEAKKTSTGRVYANVPLREVGSVVVHAIPDDPRYWPASAVFEVLPGGRIISVKGPREFFWTTGTIRSSKDSVTFVHFHLSIFRDVSQEVLQRLRKPPADRRDWVFDAPGWPFALVSNYPDKVPTVTEEVISGDSVAFSVGSNPGPFDVRILERKGDQVVPKYFACAWNKDLPRTLDAGPTPFLVYFTHQLNQNLKTHKYYKQYPDGWDYFYSSLYLYLNFMGELLDLDSGAYASRGLLPQIAASGKKLVLVLPIGNANHAEAEQGDCLDAKSMEEFLLEIQSFFFKNAGLFRSPQPYLGRVALGSFSSGNNQIPKFLSRHNNSSHRFCRDTLREVYSFDTPHTGATGWAGTALRWASTGKNAAAKVIRMYGTNAEAYAPVHYAFFSKRAPVVAPYVTTRSDRTVAILPEASWRRAIRQPGADPDNLKGFVHELMCATMLTDALRRSGF